MMFDLLGSIQVCLAGLSLLVSILCIYRVFIIKHEVPDPPIVFYSYRILATIGVLFCCSQLAFFVVSHTPTSDQRTLPLYRSLRILHDVTYDMTVLGGSAIYLWLCHSSVLTIYASSHVVASDLLQSRLLLLFRGVFAIQVIAYLISDICRPVFDQLTWSVGVLCSMFLLILFCNAIMWIACILVQLAMKQQAAQLGTSLSSNSEFSIRIVKYQWYLVCVSSGSLVAMVFQAIRIDQYINQFHELIYFGSPYRIDPFPFVIVILMYVPVVYWWNHCKLSERGGPEKIPSGRPGPGGGEAVASGPRAVTLRTERRPGSGSGHQRRKSARMELEREAIVEGAAHRVEIEAEKGITGHQFELVRTSSSEQST